MLFITSVQLGCVAGFICPHSLGFLRATRLSRKQRCPRCEAVVERAALVRGNLPGSHPHSRLAPSLSAEVLDDDLQEMPQGRSRPSRQWHLSRCLQTVCCERGTRPHLPAKSRLSLDFHSRLTPCGNLFQFSQ